MLNTHVCTRPLFVATSSQLLAAAGQYSAGQHLDGTFLLIYDPAVMRPVIHGDQADWGMQEEQAT